MNNPMNPDRDASQDFFEVITLLEKNLKYIDSLGVNTDILHDYRKIVAYLKTRNKNEIESILGPRPSPKKLVKKAEPELTDAQVANLTNDQIKALLDSQNTTRKLLERVAALRFSVSRGALSSLRTSEALRDKLATLMSNEGTHEAIARVVIGQDATNNH